MICRGVLRATHAGLRHVRAFSLPAHEVINMPALSPTMESGTIAKWLFKNGDSVGPGDAIAEIETDKASMAFEAQDDMVIAKLLVDEGVEVPVGSPIMVSVENSSDVSAFINFEAPAVAVAEASMEKKLNKSETSSIAAPAHVQPAVLGALQRFSPAARRIVYSQRLDTSAVVGTSRGGRISKADIIYAVKTGTALAKPENSYEAHKAISSIEVLDPMEMPPVNSNFIDIPNSPMRKVIARRLTESKATVPHAYSTIECRIDALLALRKEFINVFNTNVSINDLIIKAAALALRDFPDVRRTWDTSTGSVTKPAPCDIAVAVATPSGLITPIVTNADQRGCSDINHTVKELAGRAKIGKLLPEEYSGGCFSISNLGMFGIKNFSAVINPPQACILAVGGGFLRVLPPKDGENEPDVATMLSVQLSSDRRVVDEALASQFLETFQGYINQPKTILL